MRQRRVLPGENQPDLSRKIYPACCRFLLLLIGEGPEAVAKSGNMNEKSEYKKMIRWSLTVFFVTIIVSGLISFFSDIMLESSGMIAAFIVLLLIVLLGIIFDVIGVAVTTADEKPFHSMAARKVPGAREAIKLLRNAERVSSICNDVVGDICGVVSGSASATIAAQVLSRFSFSFPQVISLLMSALVAGLTVGGKAVGKAIAMSSCTQIVHSVGKLMSFLKGLKPKRK